MIAFAVCPLCGTFITPTPPMHPQFLFKLAMKICEKKVERHLREHSLLEWVTKVSKLEAELKQLKATFP